MPPLAAAQLDMVCERVIEAANSEPAKVVANKTGLTERGVRAIREREHKGNVIGASVPVLGNIYDTRDAVVGEDDL